MQGKRGKNDANDAVAIVTVHTPTGIAGSDGMVSPFLAAAMTLAMKIHEEAERFRQVSITLASNANARVPASLRVPMLMRRAITQ